MKKQTLKKLDISPETADLRLREMSALYRLGISMKGAKWMGKVKEKTKTVMTDQSKTEHHATEDEK
jgi:hypothetical protein